MKRYDIGVVGLGYVGLTLATSFAEVGLNVLGVEKRSNLVEKTNRGQPHFSEIGLEGALKRVVEEEKLRAVTQFDKDVTCDCYIITVGTPLDDAGEFRIDMITEASGEVSRNMKEGALVILRSTVAIGTTRNIVQEELKKSELF